MRRAPPVSSNDALLDDFGAEADSRTAQRLRVKLVRFVRADDEQPARPSLPDQILRERISQHGTRRRDLDHIAAAVLLAQPVIRRAGIEEQEATRAAGIGRLEQHVGGQIGDDERDAAIGKLRHRGGGIVPACEAHRLDRERLVQELAGRVVVFDGKLRAGDAVIGGGLIDERDCLDIVRAAEVSDRNFQHLRRRHRCRRDNHEGSATDDPDQAFAPVVVAPSLAYYYTWNCNRSCLLSQRVPTAPVPAWRTRMEASKEVREETNKEAEKKASMRGGWIIAILLSLAAQTAPASTGAQASAPKVAVFDFELVDTSLDGAANGPRADETARLARLGDELRRRLAQSGRVDVVDIGPVAAAAHASNLQACGGCDADLARELGVKYSVTGWVQKVSNLILNVNVVVRDAGTGATVWGKSVDMRGNTDESWSRALDYLVRNYLLTPDRGVF